VARIFAPAATVDRDNSLRAINVAKDIENALREHNRKYSEKIHFGIGVHNGEMIVEGKNGSFKFGSVGNVIPAVKRIAERALLDVGMSEKVHMKTLGKVKSDKMQGETFWRVRRVMDRAQHSDFINKFMNKQKDPKKA
jgi:hypothetical protein